MGNESEVAAPVKRRRASPRKAWLAFLMSFLMPGLGQLYNGSARKAALGFAGPFLTVLALWYGLSWGVDFGPVGFVSAMALAQVATFVVAIEAALQSRRLKEFRRPDYDQWWVYLVLYGVVNFGPPVVLPFVVDSLPEPPVQTFYTAAGSMLPTLQVNDFLVVDLRPRTDWQKGDIVVFEDPTQERDLVKRLVALPGQRVEIVDGRCLLDGEAYMPEYWRKPPVEDFEAVVVPEGEYFMMGDNVNHSRDSRYIGTIPASQMKGLVLFRFWGSEIGTEFAKAKRDSK